MIRLVTQFDSPKARAAAVTPTCSGACCCCCCCIVTMIGASIFTPWDVHSTSRQARIATPERVRWPSPWPTVLAALVLPIVLVVALFTAFTVIVPPLVWFLLAGLAYWAGGHGRPWSRAALLVVVTSVAFVAELFIWLAILFSE